MATYTNFDGIISSFEDAGAPVSFKANVFELTLQSNVRLATKDIQTILDGVWCYHTRRLTDNVYDELVTHREATEELLRKTHSNTAVCVNDKYGFLLKPQTYDNGRRIMRLIVKDRVKVANRIVLK